MFTLTVCLQAAYPSACAATPGPPSPSSRPPSRYPAGFRACPASAPPRCPTCPGWAAWAAASHPCPPCRACTAGCTSSAPPASPSSGVVLASTPRPWWPTSPSSSAAPQPLTCDRGDASLLLLFADVCYRPEVTAAADV